MAGNPANAGSWARADVFIGPLTAVTPTAGDDFSSDWDYVGLLDGGAGFGQERNSESNDNFAWGGILVETTDKNYKETHSFTALEDNETVLKLVNPGSSLTFPGTGTTAYSGTLKVPRKEKFKIAFQTERGLIIRRRVSKNYAMLEGYPSVTENEDDLASYGITVAIFPDANEELWDTYKGQKTTGGV